MSFPMPVHMTPTGEFLIKADFPKGGETFYRVRTTSEVELELDEAEPATLAGHIAIWMARPLLPSRPGRVLTQPDIIEQMDRRGRAPARDVVGWVRILGGVTLASASEALVRLHEYQQQQAFLATPYADRPPVPTPILVQVDLGKSACKSFPGVRLDGSWYLAKIDGDYYVDRFARISGTVDLRFGDQDYEAPGWNQSRWEALWLLEEVPAAKAPARLLASLGGP